MKHLNNKDMQKATKAADLVMLPAPNINEIK